MDRNGWNAYSHSLVCWALIKTELFTKWLGNLRHKAVGALTCKACLLPDSSCAEIVHQIVSKHVLVAESLSWTHVTIHTIKGPLLLSDDDDVLDEDDELDALPGFPLGAFGDGGLSCRTAEKKLVALAMEPNQNLLLGVNIACKTFSWFLLTNLLQKQCMKSKKLAKMKPPPSSPWGH